MDRLGEDSLTVHFSGMGAGSRLSLNQSRRQDFLQADIDAVGTCGTSVVNKNCILWTRNLLLLLQLLQLFWLPKSFVIGPTVGQPRLCVRKLEWERPLIHKLAREKGCLLLHFDAEVTGS